MGDVAALTVADLGEFGVIDRLAARFRSPCNDTVIAGIGDDCAVVRHAGDTAILVSTDLLVEDIHFRSATTTPRQLGWKALAVNLSDLAAMGATPRWATVGLSLPESTSAAWVDGFSEGVRELADRHGVTVVGGDVTRAPARLVIAVTVLGECPADGVLARHGARPGDWLLVTGTLGDSAAGLRLLSDETTAALHPRYPHQLAAHLTPTPRVEAGRVAADSGLVHAAIDLSDGLAGDLTHLCTQSGVGALVELDRLPLTPRCRELAEHFGVPPAEWALRGGEDYELLLAVDPTGAGTVTERLAAANVPTTVIGTVKPADFGIRAQPAQGTCERLGGAFDHFRALRQNHTT